jgi:Rrf2 family protein
LTKAGLLSSHAGMNGGYALSRDAGEITAFDVIRAIDGPLFITSCETGPRGCDLTASCTVREPLRKVNESISDVLKAIRVSDLCEHEPGRKYHGKPVESMLVSLGG